MYNLTRQEAADLLKMSTRNVDRYIKSGKLRHKKEGKTILVNTDDINKMLGGGKVNQEIIVKSKEIKEEKEITSKDIAVKTENSRQVDFIYTDLKKIIEEKDRKIENLTYTLAKVEENLKNSITMVEFKKSQFLLEQSRESLEKDLEMEKKKNNELEVKIKKENKMSMIFVSVAIIALILLVIVWFIKV
ncbi:MAG: helix-turn-helix domain-containing protein [Candidatus Gracilibacteria bacterium]|nr:helix-turn-helix domain-containing protein [Candidatus Gracilibacteria bacterium]